MPFSTFIKQTYHKFVLIFVFLTVATGCESLKVDSLELPLPKTNELNILVITSENLNPDLNYRASPIKLDFFELAQEADFEKYSYLELTQDKHELADDLIAQTEKIVKPDSVKEFVIEVNKDTKYIGLTAGFLNIEKSNWRKLLKKQDLPYILNQYNYMNLKITDSEIILMNKSQAKDELLAYRESHPEDDSIDEYGRYVKKEEKEQVNLSKGIFRE